MHELNSEANSDYSNEADDDAFYRNYIDLGDQKAVTSVPTCLHTLSFLPVAWPASMSYQVWGSSNITFKDYMFTHLPPHFAAKFYGHRQVVYKSTYRKYTKGEASPLKTVNILL